MIGKTVVRRPAQKAADPPTIVDEIAIFLRRFVVLQNLSLYRLVAVWTLGTHLLREFDYFGYLFLWSTVPQSGKSKLLEVVDKFVYRSSGILVSPTEAILFRAADETQLIDEIDSHLNVPTLRNVLNAGFQKGATVARCERVDGGFDPRKYPVYGARALAGINQHTLHETTRQRTFSIRMIPKSSNERVEKFRLRELAAEVKVLRERIESWASKNRNAVAAAYARSTALPYLQQFQDRTIDVAEPLAAIVETAYAGRTDLTDARADLVIAIAQSRNERKGIDQDRRILLRLREHVREAGTTSGTATELAELCQLADLDSTSVMSGTLRRYGFRKKSIRKPGGVPKHRYLLSDAELGDALDRYFGEGQS